MTKEDTDMGRIAAYVSHRFGYPFFSRLHDCLLVKCSSCGELYYYEEKAPFETHGTGFIKFCNHYGGDMNWDRTERRRWEYALDGKWVPQRLHIYPEGLELEEGSPEAFVAWQLEPVELPDSQIPPERRRIDDADLYNLRHDPRAFYGAPTSPIGETTQILLRGYFQGYYSYTTYTHTTHRVFGKQYVCGEEVDIPV